MPRKLWYMSVSTYVSAIRSTVWSVRGKFTPSNTVLYTSESPSSRQLSVNRPWTSARSSPDRLCGRLGSGRPRAARSPPPPENTPSLLPSPGTPVTIRRDSPPNDATLGALDRSRQSALNRSRQCPKIGRLGWKMTPNDEQFSTLTSYFQGEFLTLS